jgi:hypothetical protein
MCIAEQTTGSRTLWATFGLASLASAMCQAERSAARRTLRATFGLASLASSMCQAERSAARRTLRATFGLASLPATMCLAEHSATHRTPRATFGLASLASAMYNTEHSAPLHTLQATFRLTSLAPTVFNAELCISLAIGFCYLHTTLRKHAPQGTAFRPQPFGARTADIASACHSASCFPFPPRTVSLGLGLGSSLASRSLVVLAFEHDEHGLSLGLVAGLGCWRVRWGA